MNSANEVLAKLQSPDPSTRGEACEQLSCTDPLNEEALAALHKEADDPDALVRHSATTALAAHATRGSPPAAAVPSALPARHTPSNVPLSFSFHGRAGRLEFVGAHVVALALVGFFFLVSAFPLVLAQVIFNLPKGTVMDVQQSFVFLVGIIVWCIVVLPVAVRRSHDLGHSASFLLLGLLFPPVVFAYLLVAPGVKPSAASDTTPSPSNGTESPQPSTLSGPGGGGTGHPQLDAFLQKAGELTLSGQFDEAAEALEQALAAFPDSAASIAGYPRQTALAQSEPVSGYALLVDASAKARRRDLAVRFLERMLDLAPQQAGHACQAARAAHLAKEARRMCKDRGIRWSSWQY